MSEKMFVILCFLFYTTICCAIEPSFENYIWSDEKTISPAIDPNILEDANLTTPQLITKYGYNAEVHYVTTPDGYILQLHRISGGKKYPPKKGKKVCFLLHGLFDSSATWVLSGPGHALGYLLADDNYDVWLGNSRGNVYSCNHSFVDPYGNKAERAYFWSFSWHESGIRDLPAMIDYVLDKTGQEKMQFIGHSQGSTAFFVMASELPEYNDKIEMMHALGPIAFLSHAASPPILAIAPFASLGKKIFNLLGIYDIRPSNEFLKLAGILLCQNHAPTQIICSNIVFLVMGYNSDQLNTTLLPVIVGHLPAGASTAQMVHYGQLVTSGRFRQFDYGPLKNAMVYKRISPPEYNLRNVRAPIAIYHSQNDWLAGIKDTERLAKSLPNVVHKYLVPHKQFNHVDFTWGIDAPFLVYDEIMHTMKKKP